MEVIFRYGDHSRPERDGLRVKSGDMVTADNVFTDHKVHGNLWAGPPQQAEAPVLLGRASHRADDGGESRREPGSHGR